jgi:hypothetical protein
MTRIHKLGKYRDGFKLIEYCKVCSAEGDTLQELCPGNFPDPDDLERIEGELEDRCREG